MIISKQRAFLRSMANPLSAALMIGKGGMSGDIMRQTDDVLTARELIRGKVLETVGVTARQATGELATPLSAEIVQAVSGKPVLYRENQKEPRIVLPRSAGK